MLGQLEILCATEKTGAMTNMWLAKQHCCELILNFQILATLAIEFKTNKCNKPL